MSEFARTAQPGLWASARRGWWLFLVRGILALAIGVFALLDPRATLGALVILLGWFLLVDGAFAAIKAIAVMRSDVIWPLLLLAGFVGMAAGLAVFTWSRLTVVTLGSVIGRWTLITGLFEVVVAVALGRPMHGEYFYAVYGLVSLLFGSCVLFAPRLGLTYLTLLIAIYGCVAGIALIVLAFRLRG